MPLRSDPSLWCNLPGIVAAYQPVAGPDALSVRYNQAHGGDNRYRCEPGVLPGWDAIRGWVFNGSTQYLNSGVIQVATNWSFVVRFSGVTSTSSNYLFGSNDGSVTTGIQPNNTGVGQVRWTNAHLFIANGSGGNRTAGVAVMADRNGYINGAVDVSSMGVSAVANYVIFVGALNAAGSPLLRIAGNIQAFAAYARPLSAAEVWYVTRQLRYCDANPEWSVWGRRRRYYYAAQGPAFLAAWAANSNSIIKQVSQ